IAALMGDLDLGSVHYRLDRSPEVQERSKTLLRQAFPDRDVKEEPEGTVVITWNNMAAAGSEGADLYRGDSPSSRNSFQLLLVLMSSSSAAVLLFPRSGLQFLSSPAGGVSRALEAGFSEGLFSHWLWGETQGKQFWITTEGEESVGKLARGSNCGVRGVWVYEIGSKNFFRIEPGTVTALADDITAAMPTASTLPRQPDATTTRRTVTTRPTETEEPEYVYEDEFSTESRVLRPDPQYSAPERPHVVVEDEDLDVNVFSYGPVTCARNGHSCSPFADCRDHRSGYCCYCRPGYYGNGRDCVAEGKPQRMSGKLSGHLPEDLHSYVVANDGRAYVAISAVAPPLGPALLPLSSVGGVIGWAFALEQPDIGTASASGVFSRRARCSYSGERLTTSGVPGLMAEHAGGHDFCRYYDFMMSHFLPFGRFHHKKGTKTLLLQIINLSDAPICTCADAPVVVSGSVPEENPCFTGRHGCDINAMCKPQDGLSFSCVCSSGFSGDGNLCYDVDECLTPGVCGPDSLCSNTVGSYRCVCRPGLRLRPTAAAQVTHANALRELMDCDVTERAQCTYSGGSSYSCSCRHGYRGDGRRCTDVDECEAAPCHREALCSNTPGSFSCECSPGFSGDGFSCRPRGKCGSGRSQPRSEVFVPRCDADGQFEATQCGQEQCWSAAPTARPSVSVGTVAPGRLLAQGSRPHAALCGIKSGNVMLLLLCVQDRVVIAVAFDCVEQTVYWTEITGPSISRASLLLRERGAEPIHTARITKDPEGLALDPVSRLMFWTDSVLDVVEVSKLDGTQRRVLFDTELVNPRAIVTDPAYGRIFWTDWNRDGPKIEMSNMDGSERTVLVRDDLALPNGLSYDHESRLLCWADAGTRRVECMDPHVRQRSSVSEQVQYPFGLVSVGRRLYYSDWRREAVVALDRSSQTETQVFTPQRRSRLLTAPPVCVPVYNYCAENGGCSHLCLPRLGGFSCRCPDRDRGTCHEPGLNQV
uniref:Nidogen 1b n=1 Tax=Neogobius melanostomus TaxID=47308 RepID=A0A8C6TD52_9GOBI